MRRAMVAMGVVIGLGLGLSSGCEADDGPSACMSYLEQIAESSRTACIVSEVPEPGCMFEGYSVDGVPDEWLAQDSILILTMASCYGDGPGDTPEECESFWLECEASDEP